MVKWLPFPLNPFRFGIASVVRIFHAAVLHWACMKLSHLAEEIACLLFVWAGVCMVCWKMQPWLLFDDHTAHPDYGNPYSFQSQIQVQWVLLLALSLSCIEHIAPWICILKKALLYFFFFNFVFKKWRRTHDKGSSCGVRLKFPKYTLPGALLPGRPHSTPGQATTLW